MSSKYTIAKTSRSRRKSSFIMNKTLQTKLRKKRKLSTTRSTIQVRPRARCSLSCRSTTGIPAVHGFNSDRPTSATQTHHAQKALQSRGTKTAVDNSTLNETRVLAQAKRSRSAARLKKVLYLNPTSRR